MMSRVLALHVLITYGPDRDQTVRAFGRRSRAAAAVSGLLLLLLARRHCYSGGCLGVPGCRRRYRLGRLK